MKTILGTAIAFALTAGIAHAQSTNFDGFYVGGDIGGAISATEIGGNDIHGDGFSGGLNGGYGITYNNFYFAGEANGSISNLETEADGGAIEKKLGYGIGARVGYVLSDETLGYGVLGWERGKFEFSGNAGDGSEWANGMKWGGGVEHLLTENISLRGELSYTDWKDKDLDDVKVRQFDGKVGVGYRF